MPDIRISFQRLVSALLEQERGDDDSLIGCGDAVLAILTDRPDEALAIAHEKLHSFPYKDVPKCWQRLYTEATLWKVPKLEHEDWISNTVEALDMAIILTGAPGRYEGIQSLLRWLGESLHNLHNADEHYDGVRTLMTQPNGSHKRRKIELDIPDKFPHVATADIVLHRPLQRVNAPSLATFERQLRKGHHDSGKQRLQPFIITSTLDHWPALCDAQRSWSNPRNILKRTLGGRRLVPVELGRSYTDEGWGQKIMPFSRFLVEHMLQDPSRPERERKTGYLAQHDLFAQIPELRTDICIPDFCYASVPETETKGGDECNGFNDPDYRNDEQSDEDDLERDVLLNAWFGPAHTISPLHTDPHHNILAQVVGSKYVRLYAPDQTGMLYPRSKEGEVDMSNTSQVDMDFAMKAFEGRNFEPGRSGKDAFCGGGGGGCGGCGDDGGRQLCEKDEFAERYPRFFEAQFVEGVLGPGECLFIPKGWWHYIRSLSASCSVSFWWD